MSEWLTYPLSNLVESARPITYGVVKPGDERPLDGVILIRGGDVVGGRISPNLRTISPAISEQYKRTLLRGGELVVSLVGNPGEVAVVPHELRGANLARQVGLVALKPAIHAQYVMYALMAPAGRAALFAHTKGSVQQVINLADLNRVLVPLPEIQVQQRIASILGAYDDLIEVNRRRIAVLEEMARRLFEEWFVRFRYPGHEGEALVETADGPLPEGWAWTDLSNVAHVNAASLRPNTAPEEIEYVDIASVSPGRVERTERIAFANAPGRARRIVKDGSVIWSTVRPNRRGFALMLDPEPDVIISTGFAVLDATMLPPAYVYAWVTTDAFVTYLTNNATGAAYPAVTGATFERARVLVPPGAIAEAYGTHAEPLLRLADTLSRANARLATSRDLLLPRLLSGQLSLAAAERALEDAA